MICWRSATSTSGSSRAAPASTRCAWTPPAPRLDLTAIRDPFVQGVEAFDLNGDGNALVLDRLEMLNIADDSNTLIVLGDETNAVSGDLPGATGGAATVDGVDFQTFTLGQAELFVQTGVDASEIDTAVA